MNIIPKTRLEAFSDGVIAIIITIMVLEIRVPHGADLNALKSLLPVFLSYSLSFLYVGIYWMNHHHLLHTATRVNAKIMWSNMVLLFCLSLIPFSTNWIGENHDQVWPTVFYGSILLMAAIAYFILQNVIVETQGRDSALAKAIGKDWKGKFSLVGYVLAIMMAFYSTWISDAIYLLVALIWIIPDTRLEKAVHK